MLLCNGRDYSIDVTVQQERLSSEGERSTILYAHLRKSYLPALEQPRLGLKRNTRIEGEDGPLTALVPKCR